ncbi:FAD-linked oxidase-like protein [Coniochaeta sp. PMI_546]|nr:FAD-linked oxidase-like protein [Coniochaeta sp. PMI_546]
MTSVLPDKYSDPEYERAHRATFAPPQRNPLKPVLPPGVRDSDFSQAIQDFIGVVGERNVFIGEALSDYVDPYDIWEADEQKRKMPSAAVCPASTEELQSILRIANKFAIPLWTFSRGKNLGYGGPAPRVNGSVALDLHRMNKIIEVNDEFAYAVVEPGVTFIDLYNYCVEHRLKVWPSTASLGWGSVLGNTLDRGMGFGAHFSHHQVMAGIEVMLADGDLVRTGQWGISKSQSAFLSKFTFGPSVEGLFLQSNLGVVTKLSIWLMPQPEAFMCCSFSMPAFEDIEVMVDTFGQMRRDGTIPNCVWMTSVIETLCISGRREDFWKGDGPIPQWRVAELQQELNVGHWLARWGLYGSRRIVQAQFDQIQDVLRKAAPSGELKGALYTGEDGGLLDAASVPPEHGAMLVGVPSMWSLPLIDWPLPKDSKGKAAHGDYAPLIPSSGKMVLEWMRISQPIYDAAGIELMCDFFMYERHIVAMNMFTFDQLDPEQGKRVHGLYYGLYQEAKKRGYGMYRAHVNHMDLIADLNDFGNHSYNRFVEKIKSSYSPRSISSLTNYYYQDSAAPEQTRINFYEFRQARPK